MISSWLREKRIISLTKARMYRNERYASKAVDGCLELIGTGLDYYFNSLKTQAPAFAWKFVRTGDHRVIQDFLDQAFVVEQIWNLGKRIMYEIQFMLHKYGFRDGFEIYLPTIAINSQWLMDYCSEAIVTLQISALVSKVNKTAWPDTLSRVWPTSEFKAAHKLLDFECLIMSKIGCDHNTEQKRLAASISSGLTGVLESGRHRIKRELSRWVIEEIYSGMKIRN